MKQSVRLEIEQLLSKVRKPLTYIAVEDNAVFKDKPLLNICLIYPDLYELGIGNLGLNILYSTLNHQAGIWAQRAYMPDLDMQEVLDQTSDPLFSLEEQRPLNEFNILGFSLPHELCFTNVLKIIELSQIPIKCEERNDGHPLVIAGGNAAFNPLPLAPFIDAFVIGDGEEVVLELAEVIRGETCLPVPTLPIGVGRRGREVRKNKIKALSEIEGVWVPSLYSQHKGTVPRSIRRGLSPVKKRTVADLNSVGFEPLVPTSRGEKRLVAEVMRGCTAGCRFCQAGFINRPLREKDASAAFKQSVDNIDNCGLNQLSLLSLSTSDYSQIEPLVSALTTRLSPKNVSLSLPSLRLDEFSICLLNDISAVKKTGLTFAIEAASQRLRDLINKGLSEEQILSNLEAVFASGWQKIKLYFMVGLPTETEQDLKEMVRLLKKIELIAKDKLGSNKKRLNIVVSVSNFVPKAHTPFQWCAQNDLKMLEQKHRFLTENIKGANFTLRWHNSRQSVLEGLFARGDEKIAVVLEKAYGKGALFDNFSERFDFNIWQEAINESKIDVERYLGGRDIEKELPWNFIDSGADKQFLVDEYNKGLKGELTPDCRDDKCSQCGVCDKELKNRFSDKLSDPEFNLFHSEQVLRFPQDKLRIGILRPSASRMTLFDSQLSQKYRLYIKREGYFKYLSHLEWINLIERRMRQANLNLATKGKYNRRPKFSFSQALPVGSKIVKQHVDFTLLSQIPLDSLQSRLKKVFSKDLVFQELQVY